jgi:hypothetical protein
MDLYCWKCGIGITGAGTFCESCGALVHRASLAAVGGTPTGNVFTMPATREVTTATRIVTLADPPSPARAGRPAWEIVVAIGLAVILLSGLVLWGVNDYGTHQKLRETRGALALTSARLHSTTAALASTKATLAQRDAQVTNLIAIRRKLLHELGITRKQLAEARGSLSHARSQISLQAGQITSLKTCLGGVNLALNDLWNYDYSGMASALGAVQGACNQSSAMF